MPKKYIFSFFLTSITDSMKNIWHGVFNFKAVAYIEQIHFLKWPNKFLTYFLENDIFLGHSFSDFFSSEES